MRSYAFCCFWDSECELQILKFYSGLFFFTSKEERFTTYVTIMLFLVSGNMRELRTCTWCVTITASRPSSAWSSHSSTTWRQVLPSLTEHYFYLMILAISKGMFFLKPDNCSPHLRFISVTLTSVADPGSGAFWPLEPESGSGIGKKCGSGSGIQDEHPRSVFRNRFLG